MEWLFVLLILIFSVVIHEISHGAMANYLGDPTAKNEGRLTLNPLKHLDLVGSVLVPGFLLLISEISSGPGIIFGWAKPVPINPYNFRDQKYGSLKTAIAGPLANLAIALIFGLVLRFFSFFQINPGFSVMFFYIVYLNILLAVFNLLPFPPLDGSHILFAFLSSRFENLKIFLNEFGLLFLFFIIFFLGNWLGLIIKLIFTFIVGQ